MRPAVLSRGVLILAAVAATVLAALGAWWLLQHSGESPGHAKATPTTSQPTESRSTNSSAKQNGKDSGTDTSKATGKGAEPPDQDAELGAVAAPDAVDLSSDRIQAIRWGAEGELFTVGDMFAVQWDPATGKRVRCWKHSANLPRTVYPLDPDCRRLLLKSPFDMKPGVVLDLASGKTRTFHASVPGTYRLLAWAPDGRTAIFRREGAFGVVVWDLQTAAELGPLKLADRETVWHSPLHGLVICKTKGSSFSLYAPASLLGSASNNLSIRDFVWAPSGKYFATLNDNDLPLVVWDARTREDVYPLEPMNNRVEGAQFSPNSERLAVLCWDVRRTNETGGPTTVVKVVEAGTGADLAWLGERGVTQQLLRWHPDGARIAVVSGQGTYALSVWHVDRREKQHHVKLGKALFLDPEYSPDGKYLAVGQASGGQVVVLDGATAEERWSATLKVPAKQLVWNSTGNYLAAGAAVWDAASGKPALELTPADSLKQSRWHVDGRRLATLHREGAEFAVWDAPTGKQLCRVTLTK